jgi:PAS domain S-box-containing protein
MLEMEKSKDEIVAELEALKVKYETLKASVKQMKSTDHKEADDKIASTSDETDSVLTRNREALRLELAIDAVNMAWWDMDIITGNVIFHPRKAHMLGYKPEQFNHYRDFMNLVHPDDYETAMTAMRNHFAGKAPTYDTEYRIKTSEGNYKWFYDIGTIVSRDENGKPLKIIGFVIDISRQKQTEQQIVDLNANLEMKILERTAELAAMNERLLVEIEVRKAAEEESIRAMNEAKKAMLAKSEFMSRMSHELRTPLNSILGFAQLMELGELNNGQRKGINHILKSGKQLLNLINEVLDITQIETGRFSLSLEPVQPKNIFNEVLKVVKPLAEKKNVSVEILSSEYDNLFVKADYQRFKQALINLVENGVKYNKDGGTVIIKTEPLPDFPKENVPLKILVTDNGVGIAKEDIPKLFSPFERIGKNQNGAQGSGLGLTLVKNLVNVMGGQVGVESSTEVGSTFWMQFQQIKGQMETANVSKMPEDDAKSISEKKSTILYVEDNVSNIELVEQILSNRSENIRFLTSTSGKKSIEIAVESKPDLILLDLDLPDIHGSEVLELLQSHPTTEDIPVVVISADAMPHRLQKLLKAGAKNYLTKPLDVNSFLKILDQYI